MSLVEFDLTVTLSLIVSLTAMMFAWFRTRRKDLDGKFDRIDERLTGGSRRMNTYDLRLQALEQTVDSMPGKDHLHRLEVALTEIGGDLKAMTASMNSVAESQRRTEAVVMAHEDHLRETSR